MELTAKDQTKEEVKKELKEGLPESLAFTAGIRYSNDVSQLHTLLNVEGGLLIN